MNDNETKRTDKTDFSESEAKEFLQKFFSLSRTCGKGITLEDIRRIEEESYDD